MYGTHEESADFDVEGGQYDSNSTSAPVGFQPGAPQIEGTPSLSRPWSLPSEGIARPDGRKSSIMDAPRSPSIQAQSEQPQVEVHNTERCKQGIFNFFRGITGSVLGMGSAIVGSTILNGAGYAGHDSQEALAAGAAIGGSIFVGLRSAELFAINCAMGRNEAQGEQNQRMSSFVLQVVGAISSAAAGYLMFSPDNGSKMSSEQLVAAMAVGTTVTAGAISIAAGAKSYFSS